MQLSEARVFELMGRLHAENRVLADENAQLRAALDRSQQQAKLAIDEGDKLRAEINALMSPPPAEKRTQAT